MRLIAGFIRHLFTAKKAFVLLFILLPATVYSETDAGFWQQINRGIAGYTAVRGQESGVLIQTNGQQWRRLRNGLVKGTGAWAIAVTVFALSIFFMVRGQVKLSEPRTGELIQRWSVTERAVHGFTATLFLLLMLTGLSLLYGSSVVMPIVGQNVFAQFAQWAKIVHNYTGPLFIIGLVMMIILWFKDNQLKKIDIQWFKEWGGLIGDKHPSAERMNGGEKLWFWLLVFAGSLVSISGLLLDFSNFGFTRETLQFSHLIHAMSAIALIVGSFGHIYIGTIGTEGAFEGMKTGKVDTSWAKQHHNIWFKKYSDKSGG